ncbi:MAG: DUF5017 domain-containing protein, partial [Bacteroidetes bacterium]|nr:DUF5017 domain-containing protein [Bacteroidota bacterium]
MKQKLLITLMLAVMLVLGRNVWGQEALLNRTFEIYRYNETGTEVNYPTSATIPSVTASTLNTRATLPYTQVFEVGLGDITFYNVSGSTKRWYWNSTSQCASVNGFNSGELEEDWLILPSINLDNYEWEYLTFDSWYNYGTDDADNYLKLMYATDYAGDPTTATWTELSFTAPSTTTTWTSSGVVDLNSITGTDVVLAFKYHYNAGMYRWWSIDNISIQQCLVTFQVDMSEQSVSPNGVHIAGNFNQAFWDPAGI